MAVGRDVFFHVVTRLGAAAVLAPGSIVDHDFGLAKIDDCNSLSLVPRRAVRGLNEKVHPMVRAFGVAGNDQQRLRSDILEIIAMFNGLYSNGTA